MADARTYEELNSVDDERRMRLEESRFMTRRSRAKIKQAPRSKISSAEAIMMILLGVIIDIASFIPVIGWPIDICGGGIIWFWQTSRGFDQKRPWFLKWMPGMGTIIGFIPILPAHTATILIIIAMNTKLAQQLIQKFSPR